MWFTILFRKKDKKQFKKGKFLSTRAKNCKFQTGKKHKLNFGLNKPAEAEAFFQDSFLYDLNCLTDTMANYLGYDSKEEYLKEGFNQKDNIKKVYIMKDITFF